MNGCVPYIQATQITSSSASTTRDQRAEYQLTSSNMKTPPFRQNGRPSAQHTVQTAKTVAMTCLLVVGHWSMIAEVTASVIPNCVSSPSVRIMVKKRKDHKGANGNSAKAAGYAINVRPGPELTTSPTGTPKLCAMKPTMEKITKPEKTEVAQLETLTTRASRRQLLENL